MKNLKKYTTILACTLLSSSFTPIQMASALSINELIEETYGHGITLEDIKNCEQATIEEAQANDFIYGSVVGIKKNKTIAEILKDNKRTEISIEDLPEDIEVYKTSEGIYEKPDIKKTSQQLKKEIALLTYNTGAIKKEDKESKEVVEDQTYSLLIASEKNDWQKIATLNSNDVEGQKTYKVEVSTKEYNKKEWITNYDKLSPKDKEKYKDLPKEEPEDKDKKRQDELEKELNDKIAEVKKHPVKWLITEDPVKNGYEQSTKTWTGDIEDGKIEIKSEVILSKKLTGIEKAKKEKKLKTEIELSFTATDEITKERLNGGLYDIFISYIDQPEDSKKIATASLRNGKIEGIYKIETTEPVMLESDNMKFVKEYRQLPSYAKEMYSDYAKSRKQAKEEAKENVEQKLKKAQEGYENAERVVRIVEREAPEGYLESGDTIIPVKKGKAEGSLTTKGSSNLAIHIQDMSGNEIEGAKIKVESIKGNHKIKEIRSLKNKPALIDGIIAGDSYKVTQLEAPKGYVKLRDSIKTVTSKITGEIKDTTITELKASYQHKIAGVSVQVLDDQEKVVDEWTTTAEPHNIENLEQYKTYTLKEVSSPEGYYLNKPITFKVEERDVELKANSFSTTMNTEKIKGAEYTIIDKETGKLIDTWTGGKKEIANLEAERTYVLKQSKTPRGYVQLADFELKPAKRDQVFTLKNSKVSLYIQDAEGKGIEGTILEIKDSKGNAVEEYVTDGGVYNPVNLQAGNEYTISQKKASGGYTRAKAYKLSIDKNGTNYTQKMVSEIKRINLVNEKENQVKGAYFEVKDRNDKVVDSWISGRHIIDLTDFEKDELTSAGQITLKEGGIKSSLSDAEVKKAKANLNKAIELELTNIYNKEDDYTAQTYYQMVFEQINLPEKEKEKKIDEYTKKIQPIKTTGDLQKAEEVKKEIAEDLDKVIEKTAKVYDKAKEAEIRMQEDGTYTLKMTDEDGYVARYDIDANGNETIHRLNNIAEDQEYTIQSSKPAGKYLPSQTITVEPKALRDEKITLHTERKVKVGDTTPQINKRNIAWLTLGVVGAGVVGIFLKLTRRKVQ